MVNQASVEDAFRTPAAEPAREIENSIRKQIDTGRDLKVELLRQNGFTQWTEWLILSRRVLKISGRFDAILVVAPSGIKIDGASSVIKSTARWIPEDDTMIAVLDLMGDHPVHFLRIRTRLPFLHPFVSLHLEVQLDGEVVFAEGKFATDDSE